MRDIKAILITIIACTFLVASCSKTKTGSCHIVCTSASYGTVYSDETFPNYTQEECDAQHDGTTTTLVPCTKEWTPN